MRIIKEFKNKEYFVAYFTGLFESCGHFHLFDDVTRTPNFVLVLHEENIDILENIKIQLGFGDIYSRKSSNCFSLEESKLENLLVIIDLLRLHIRTTKVYQINKVIMRLNIYNKKDIMALTPSTEFYNNNAWFAGFIESRGNFYFTIRERVKSRFSVEFGFSLNQPEKDETLTFDNNIWLKPLADFFSLKLYLNKVGKNPAYRLHAVNKDDLKQITVYLEKFPLVGVKQSIYLFWKQAYFIYCNRNTKNVSNDLVEQLKKLQTKIVEKDFDLLNSKDNNTVALAANTITENYRFKFTLPDSLLVKEKFFTDSTFASYLAGLYEGDGHFKIYSQKRRDWPSFTITLYKTDFLLLKFVKEKLGFGKIYFTNKYNTVLLVVACKAGIITLLNTICPYIRTPKIRQINYNLTQLKLHKNYARDLFQITTSQVQSNSWFSGFIEAEGNFQIYVSPIKKIIFTFTLDQQLIDKISKESYRPCLTQITDYFGANLELHKHNTGKYYFRMNFSSETSILKLISYIDEFPLYGIKSLDYLAWKEAFYLYKNRPNFFDIDDILIDKIINLKSQMNNARTDFLLPHFK